MISIYELGKWIMSHRTSKAFYEYSFDKILQELSDCADHNGLLCITDNNNIVGVICCEPSPADKILYVYDILATKRGVVKRMMKEFVKRFNGYSIEGKNRNGRYRKFMNTDKLERRL